MLHRLARHGVPPWRRAHACEDAEDVWDPGRATPGALLDKALEQAGVSRDAVYITNAVKHFKWQLRGKTPVLVAYHPSFALRSPDPEGRQAAFQTIVEALRRAGRLAGKA